jgi:hypothetical protein
MKVGTVQFLPPPSTAASDNRAAAQAVAQCGDAWARYLTDGVTAPPSWCTIAKYAQGNTCTSPSNQAIGATRSDPVAGAEDTSTYLGGGVGDATSARPGFAYWTMVKGPFWQQSPNSVPFGDPAFVGSALRVLPGVFQKQRFIRPIKSGTRAKPDGTLEAIAFDELPGSPTGCTVGQFSLNDPTGFPTLSFSVNAGAVGPLRMLSDFIGNVAQRAGNTPDVLQVRDSPFTSTIFFQQSHSAPLAPATYGPFTATMKRYSCPSWTPTYLVKDVLSTADAGLVSGPDAKNAVCFISGLRGAWSSDRDNGATQPYAQIYTDTEGTLRLRVFPSTGVDAVGAYASCIRRN